MTPDLDYCDYNSEDVLTAMERIHAATVDSATLNDMLVRILDEILEIFHCDRAFLIYPCLLEASHIRVFLERTKPEWPGASSQNGNISMDNSIRAIMEACVNSDEPVRFDALSSPVAISQNETMRAFNIRSQLIMALWPKGDDPWALGIHHCAQAHVYEHAVPLFRAIGNRVADAIGGTLAMRGLRQGEERFRALVEHAPEAITMIDVDTGLYVDANPMAEALHELSRDALIGKIGPADLSPEIQPDGRPSSEVATEYMSRALAGEFPRFEWTHRTPDGQETFCEVSLARLPDPRRNLVRASIFDITERKAAEAERAELEDKLAQAQKMEAVGQLTGGIAHDFNNLLAIILGNLELAEDMLAGDGNCRNHVEMAIKATERGANLTQRLLAFSRKQALRPVPVDGRKLIQDMQNLLRHSLGETIEIEIVADAGLWASEIDPSQLEGALLNLAINARDAMPDGGKLTIEASNARLTDEYAAAQIDVEPGQYVLVSVSDTGMGMAPEVRELVFEPFFTTKEVGKGTGLGLSMVHGFVKQSGGHIAIYSEVGEGTTVKLYLPRYKGKKVAVERGGQTDEPVFGMGEVILVVEDDVDLRTMILNMLQSLGYRVLESGAATSALEVLDEASQVNLLLTDVVLPGGMSGRALSDKVRETYPDLPVLYMSGYTENAIIHHGRLDEGVQLLEKPFRKADLARAIGKALESKPA